MAKKIVTITESQKLQLIGLKVVAGSLYKQIDSIHKAARGITKESDECGHTYDYLSDYRDIDEVLQLLEIRVKK